MPTQQISAYSFWGINNREFVGNKYTNKTHLYTETHSKDTMFSILFLIGQTESGSPKMDTEANENIENHVKNHDYGEHDSAEH